MKQLQFLILCIAILNFGSLSNGARIYVHMMPWFESKETNGGVWGIHWTMANRNPDNMVDGKQDIASYYHPEKGAYASSDPAIIDWQLSTMKAAGIAGIFMDWPGTNNFADYAKNMQNAEAIIDATERNGLEFAIIYEDNNLNLAGVDDKIGQGIADMQYIQSNYFSKGNYLRINGAPFLGDFGPQALVDGGQWDAVFAPLDPKPTFITLWYQSQQGGSFCQGEMAWIYSDWMDGLRNWYANVEKTVKIGVAYPGFNSFYEDGGWPGPGFTIPVGPDTFRDTLTLAVENTEIVQVATWNDYGEGTIIEPTLEFGYQYLDIIQRVSGTKYTQKDFKEASLIYDLRKQNAGNATMLQMLEKRHEALIHKYD